MDEKRLAEIEREDCTCDAGMHAPSCRMSTAIDELVAEVRQLRESLQGALDLAEDAYSQHGAGGWYQLKYGEWFDAELAKARAALGPPG